jgi:hypothetical protein
MANLLKAVNQFRPKIKLGKTVESKEVFKYMADRTSLNKGSIQIVAAEFADAIAFFNKQGRGVKIEGLGTYYPKIAMDGKFSVSHRLDKDIKSALNTDGSFSGDIVNKANIGKTKEELIEMWNEAFPDDKVIID